MFNLRVKAAVLLAASGCALTAACNCEPEPPVKSSALHEFLLSPSTASKITGATLTELKTAEDLGDESGLSSMSDKQCLGVTEAAGKTEYANSGSSAVRRQLLANLQSSVLQQESPVEVTQAVVLFPSAQQAAAFFTAASKTWSACANKKEDIGLPKLRTFGLPTQMDMSIGRVADADETLTADISLSEVIQGKAMTMSCRHLLTVANNVVVDVTASSGKIADSAAPPPPVAADAAGKIAQEIAANVDDHQD